MFFSVVSDGFTLFRYEFKYFKVLFVPFMLKIILKHLLTENTGYQRKYFGKELRPTTAEKNQNYTVTSTFK